MPKHAMIDAKYRRLMLIQPESVRQSVLTDLEIDIVKHVERRGHTTSPAMADAFGMTVQNASNRLAQLIDKGYLVRYNAGSPSGGDMFEYKVHPEIWSKKDES